MRDHLKTVPNQLTAARLVLLPILWALAFLGMSVLVGIGLIFSFVTDVLDGYLARRLGQVSDFGSKFDSLVDNLLIPSALVWVWLLRPEVYRDHILMVLMAIVLYFSSLLIGIVKFRRFANLHLQSKRLGSVLMYLFVAHTLMADHYNVVLFYLALIVFLISSVEGLALQLICSRVDEHMGSILFILKHGDPS
jgi:cardiolipin synthase (CMP-forming)